MMEDIDEFQKKLNGVGGWLLLFCVSLVLIRPVLAIYSFSGNWSQIERVFSSYPNIKSLITVELIFDIILVLWGIVAGIKLWSLSRNAPRFAKIFLASQIGYSLLTIGLPFLFGMPQRFQEALAAEAFKGSLKTLLGAGLWLIYLSVSARVNITYSEKQPSTNEEDYSEPTGKNDLFIYYKGDNCIELETPFMDLLNNDFNIHGNTQISIIDDKPTDITPEAGDSHPLWNMGVYVAKKDLDLEIIKRLLDTFHKYSVQLNSEFIVGFYDAINKVDGEITTISMSANKDKLLKEILIYF